MEVNLSNLITEQRNDSSKAIDQLSTTQILKVINDEDRTVAEAVQKTIPDVSIAVDAIYQSLSSGGKLFYVGAGTSGRLGVIDAAECPPTFSTPPDLVQAILAGGDQAILTAVEGAEDNEEQGAEDLMLNGLTDSDVIVGITASGRTPYVAGALKYARSIGASTIALSCNNDAVISELADYSIEVVVGPEVLTGSTRMKAATAQKMVLNMMSTAAMIKLGKVYENLMVDVNASNQKLVERARRIVMTITDSSYETATEVLSQTNQEVKPAIVMIKTGVDYKLAIQLLVESDGFVRQAIQLAEKLSK